MDRLADNQLLAVLIGAFVALLGTIWVEHWKERRRVGPVKTMLRLEIERNLRILVSLRETMSTASQGRNRSGSFDDAYEERQNLIAQAEALIDSPVPAWSRAIWSSETAFIPRALSEDQIKQISSFYDALEQISVLRQTLALAREEDRQTHRALSIASPEPRFPFLPNTFPSLVTQATPELNTLVRDTITKGEGCRKALH